MPIYEPDMSYEEMRKAERSFKCAKCPSDLITAWSAQKQKYILRCRKTLEHEGIVPWGRDPGLDQMLHLIRGKELPMETTALTKLTPEKMLTRVNQAKWPKDLTAADRQLISKVAIEYGLDPLFNELMIYQGRPYVTIDARRRKAQETGELDGTEPRPATKEEKVAQECKEGDILWKADIWKKGCSHPFTGWGKVTKKEIDRAIAQAKAHGSQEDALPIVKDPQGQANKRAQAQGLREAFHLPLPSAEDIVEGEFTDVTVEKPAPKKPTAPTVDHPTQAQINKLWTTANQQGWKASEVNDYIKVKFGVDSVKDLTVAQMSTLIKAVENGEGLTAEEVASLRK